MNWEEKGNNMSMDDFKAKWGLSAAVFRFQVEQFIRRSPQFDGDIELAKRIGECFADLESALKD